jgi:hypothetical protein
VKLYSQQQTRKKHDRQVDEAGTITTDDQINAIIRLLIPLFLHRIQITTAN